MRGRVRGGGGGLREVACQAVPLSRNLDHEYVFCKECKFVTCFLREGIAKIVTLPIMHTMARA